ncbi:hypothetical protein A2U01_0049486, partial [Trifolium medium]|nr:hypothetical protein [Trifolium medium]
MYHHSRGSVVCGRMRRLGVSLALISFLQHLWLSLVVISERAAPSYSLFGSYMSGLFGTKEITDYSETQNNPY